MSSIKSVAKDWLPPAIVRAVRNFHSDGICFEGDYGTWEEAAAQCSGYGEEHILAKVLEATLKVKRGEAAYERDSVLFDEIQYAWPVTASLMWVAAQNGGRLDVLDFGGALGSSYFQNRRFLAVLPQLRWSVIEQAHYVEAGKAHIADDRIRFYESVARCLLEGQPNAVLLSSVLQYLPDPKSMLSKLAAVHADYLIVDRTPFLNKNDSSQIKIQRVPSVIYSASYPCWLFNFDESIKYIESLGYQKIEVFNSLDKLSDLATWQGLIFKKESGK